MWYVLIVNIENGKKKKRKVRDNTRRKRASRKGGDMRIL
jgi:hypothetical protein